MTKRIELTIKVDYLPNWGLYEGIRELIQNGKDAETEQDATFTVKHTTNTLTIENKGATLKHEALLLGHTTKEGRADLIGKFGEGLKLGILAIVRAGHSVIIRSGSETWTPKIERSSTFNADVLAFHIEDGARTSRPSVTVQIEGVASDAWKEMKDNFLFLTTRKNDEAIETPHGHLLCAPRMKGSVFVKGIFVQRDASLDYGYDFKDAELDRDRRIVDSYDRDQILRKIWEYALAIRPDIIDDFSKMLEKQSADVMSFQWNTYNVPDAATERIAVRFVQRHGRDAVPVDNLAESRDVDHLGKKGIIVPKALGAVLRQVFGAPEDIKSKLAQETVRVYSHHELTEIERRHLFAVVDLCSDAFEFDVNRLKVADFRSPGLQGLWTSDGSITLSRSILEDRTKTLMVLIHEAAHDSGGDGEKDHVHQIESLWKKVADRIWIIWK